MATKKTAKKQNKKTESNLFDFSSMQDRAERLLENVKTDGEKYARKSFEICKDFADDVRKDPSRVVTDIIDSGKDFVSDIQKDVRKKFNGMVKKGRKTIDEFPTMKTIEKRIYEGFKAIPDRINLASKKDIDKLITSMETLNKKLDSLSHKYSAR